MTNEIYVPEEVFAQDQQQFLTRAEVIAMIQDSLTNLIGDVRLQRGGLQSKDFQENVSGWKIDALGNFIVGALAWNKFTLLSSFESIDGMYQSIGAGGAITVGLGGTTMDTGATNNTEVIMAVQPNGSNSMDFAKNPMFQTRAKIQDTANNLIYLTVGEGANASGRYFGFKISGSTVSTVNRNASTETSTTISGITTTNWNTFKAVMRSADHIDFYINGNLVATHLTNLPTTTSSLLNYFYIKNTTASSRVMWIANFLFSQEF